MRFFEILFSFIAGASCQANDFLDGKCLCFLEHAFRFLEFINTGTYVCPALIVNSPSRNAPDN